MASKNCCLKINIQSLGCCHCPYSQLFAVILMTALATCSSCWQRVYGQGIPFSQLTSLICITMYLNEDVRQFRAETAKLRRIVSHPLSNKWLCKWVKVAVKKAISKCINCFAFLFKGKHPLNGNFVFPWAQLFRHPLLLFIYFVANLCSMVKYY